MNLRLTAALVVTASIQAAPDPEGVRFFETRIRPVLASRCAACHGSALPAVQGALILDTVSGIRKGGNSGTLVTAGDPDTSLIIRALRHGKDLKMPPGKPLEPA